MRSDAGSGARPQEAPKRASGVAGRNGAMTAAARKKSSASPKPELREPTAAETKAIGEAAQRQLERPARANLKVSKSEAGVVTVASPHSDDQGSIAHLRETFGSRSNDFVDYALTGLMNSVGQAGKAVQEEAVNAGLAMLGAIAPRDELEAAIAQQIVAAHHASLEFLSRARLNMGEYRDTACAYVNAATKLSRTMAVQIEALAKLRSGGKQTHEVRYVYVNGPVFGPGAQAMFGSAPGGGVRGTNFDQPHAATGSPALAFAPGIPVWSEDAERNSLPIPSGERPETLPDARGCEGLGSAEGEGERAVSDGSLHTGASSGAGAGAGTGEAGARDRLK